MADMSTPLKGISYTLCFTLYKNDGTVVANPGTITKKIRKNGGATADITAAVTEEDTTYGALSLVLSTAEMNADRIWAYITDDTAGTVPFTLTLYPAAGNAYAEALAVRGVADNIIDATDDIIEKIDLETPYAVAAKLAVVDHAAGVDIAADIIALKTVADDAASLALEIQTDWTNGGRLDTIIDAILADTGTTLDDLLDAVKAKTDTIGALAVTVSSPVATSGDITLYAGDDYDATHGRSIDFTVAVADVPNLAGATVKLKTTQATWTATACTSDGTDWTIVFEPDAADTAAITDTRQNYELEARLADGDVVTLATGELIAVMDIPAVP